MTTARVSWRRQLQLPHTHTQGHTHIHLRTLSFIHSCQGQEQGDKCCPTVWNKRNVRAVKSRAEQSRAKEAAAKVMPGIFSSLAWIKLEYATQHKPEAKVQETNKQKAQEKAGCDGLEDTLGKPINKILILNYLQYFFGIFKIPDSTHNYVYN